MSSDRLDELDQTSAIFGALGSFWPRILTFFVLLWTGHFLGDTCFRAPEFFDALRRQGFPAFDFYILSNVLWAPVTWLATVVFACSQPIFLVWLFVLGGAFLNIWLSEQNWFHGLAIAAIGQPIQTYCAHLAHHDRSFSEVAISLALLSLWEALVITAYWWFWRQRR